MPGLLCEQQKGLISERERVVRLSPSASILTLARRLSAYLALLDALEASIWFGALAIVP